MLGDTAIKEGDKIVIWYVSANRDEAVFEDPSASTSSAPRTTTWPSAAAVPTSAWAPTWPASRSGCCSRRCCAALPDLELAGEPERLRSNFINGIKHIPLRFSAAG